MRLVLCTITSALLLAACGGRGAGDTDSGTTTLGGTGTETEPTTNTGTPTGTDPTNPTNPTGTTSPTAFDCVDALTTPGPWDGGGPVHPLAAAGIPTTATPYTFDAGLGAIIAAAAGQADPIAVDLPVSGAIVVAHGYVPAVPTDNTIDLYLQDASGAVLGFRVDVGMDPNLIEYGDAVSFTATEVQDFFGTIEISGISNFSIDSSGNEVFVNDIMGGASLDFDLIGNQMVEVWGEIMGPPTDCGADCWMLDYGAGEVTFRTSSTFIYEGDCVQFIGPLTQFGGVEQLDTDDYDWYRVF